MTRVMRWDQAFLVAAARALSLSPHAKSSSPLIFPANKHSLLIHNPAKYYSSHHLSVSSIINLSAKYNNPTLKPNHCYIATAPTRRRRSLSCQGGSNNILSHHDNCFWSDQTNSNRRQHRQTFSTGIHHKLFMSSHDNNNPHMPQPPPPDSIKLQQTKYGKMQRKTNDKLTKNARVRNSYLKIIMEDAVLDQLHRKVCDVKQQWDTIQNNNNNNNNLSNNNTNEDIDSTITPQTIISKKQSKRKLTIKPRTRTSLHMTYFFAGKVLEDMSAEELERWETMVRKCVLTHSKNNHLGDEYYYSLRFKCLATFPPRRNNLIVAVFESCAALDDLYEQLCSLALMEKESNGEGNDNNNGIDGETSEKAKAAVDGRKEYEFPLLAELTKKQQKHKSQHASSSPWIAHVTLGNLVGGTKDDLKRMREWLDSRLYEEATANDDTEHSSALEGSIHAVGLALGGPVPEQVDVDWNFPFHHPGNLEKNYGTSPDNDKSDGTSNNESGENVGD